jgi:hypothetical protein
MDDALSAASLLLAALALIYSAWSASIEAAATKQMGTTDAAIERSKSEVRETRNRRAVPLAIGCWLILAGFAVRDIRILATAWKCVGPVSCDYDDIAVVFLLTQVFVFVMAIHMYGQIRRLNKKL